MLRKLDRMVLEEGFDKEEGAAEGSDDSALKDDIEAGSSPTASAAR